MSSLGEVNVKLGLVIKGLEDGIKKAKRKLDRFARATSEIGDNLTRNISLPLAALGVASIKSAAEFERFSNGLTSVMEDSAAAKQEMELLAKAAQDPGLDLTQAVKGSIRLQSVKVDAELARKALSNFGNAIALAGGTSEDLDGVTLALTQIISKGKISAEEINQLAERVPQVRQAIQDAFGTSDSIELQKKGIDVRKFVEIVTDEMGKLPKATGGMSNSINNAGQAIQKFLVTIGNDINESFDVTGRINEFSDFLQDLADRFSSLDPAVKATVIKVAAFIALIGPAIKIISLFVSTISSGIAIIKLFVVNIKALGGGIVSLGKKFVALDMTMKATAIGAVIAVVATATIAYSNWANQITAAQAAQQAVNEVNLEAKKSVAAQRVEVNKLLAVLKDEDQQRDNKIAAFKELNKIAPEYLEGLTLENSSLEDINAAMDQYLVRLERRARFQAANERLVEIEKELLDVGSQMEKAAPGVGDYFNTFQNGFGLLAAADFSTFKDVTKAQLLIPMAKQREELEAQRDAMMEIIKDTDSAFEPGKKKKTRRVETTITASGVDQKDIAAAEEQRLNKLVIMTQKAREQMAGLIGDTEESINNAIRIDPEALEGIRQLPELMMPAVEESRKLAENMQNMIEVSEAMSKSMQEAVEAGASSLKELGKVALKSAADFVRAKMMEAIAAYITKVIATSGPLGILLAGAGSAIIGALFNKAMKTINVPGFADGVNNFGGGLAVVGERGPELLNLPRGSDVIPNHMLGGGATNNKLQGEFHLAGDKLILLVENMLRQRSRSGLNGLNFS